MKVFCILLYIAFASGFYIDNNGTHENKILGGYYVKIADVPYQASIIWLRINNICGATIIHKSWVITAAHCVKEHTHVSVRTGSRFRQHSGEEHRVEIIIIHGDYGTNGQNNDIALIKLEVPITFNNEQQPIELAKSHDSLREGELIQISGFGDRGYHLGLSDTLKTTYVPVLNQEYCERIFRLGFITDKMFCAGNAEANACPGDSGGPGVIHGKLYGIISSGKNCESKIFPTVYTRVYKYYHWIEEKTELRF